MDMEDASETPIIQCVYLLLQGRGQAPYLRTIEKYWKNARIVESGMLAVGQKYKKVIYFHIRLLASGFCPKNSAFAGKIMVLPDSIVFAGYHDDTCVRCNLQAKIEAEFDKHIDLIHM